MTDSNVTNFTGPDDTYREQPTQARYPWRATLRTALALVGSLVVVLPLAWSYLAEALEPILPDNVLAGIAGVVASIVLIATAITRIMAIPLVNVWLTKIGVGAAPKTAGEPVVAGEANEPND